MTGKARTPYAKAIPSFVCPCLGQCYRAAHILVLLTTKANRAERTRAGWTSPSTATAARDCETNMG